ncbi:OmpA family protein [Luteimonas sp. 22616]|uniref:OmpA family protein n=1 Tax=Luteimonas sp. 22616 TaxID=3453951 RepID=UPI003F83552D
MNKKLLCAALLAGIGFVQAANAQEFDDRWYLTGSVGYNFQDNDRQTKDAPFGTIGVGKFLTPNWSIDGELNYQNPNNDANDDLNWSQYGISFDARYHFIAEGRSWNPYLLAGLGYQRAEEEVDNFPNPNSPLQREDGHVAGKLGVGVQSTLARRVGVRAELAYRIDADNDSYGALASDPNHDDGEDWFGDILASVGVVIPLGPEPTAPVAPAPAAPSCADMDSDGDGVNDCDDKCPDSQAGQTIGPDGCPVPVSIDLKGVNFDFDKSTLRPDAVAILNEAIEILKRYPDLRVEVAGHTDSKGTDAYNQALSERRASAVYDYLTSNGIDAGRLVGPVGYGESRPIAPNTNDDGSDNPEGRARNRRTELNVQN